MLYFLYFHQSIKKSFREISSLIFHMILFKYTVALMNPFLWIEMKKIKGAIWVFSSSTDIPPVLTWQPLRRSSSSSRTGLNTCQTPTMGCLSTADISVIWGEFLVKWAILSRGTVGSQTGDIISTFEAIVWFFFSFLFFFTLHYMGPVFGLKTIRMCCTHASMWCHPSWVASKMLVTEITVVLWILDDCQRQCLSNNELSQW